MLFPDPAIVRDYAKILEKYNLSVFNQPRIDIKKLAFLKESILFSIDTINDQILAQQKSVLIFNSKQDEQIKVAGWAVDSNAGLAAGGVFLNIDGKTDIPTYYGIDRQDVADHFKNNNYRYSGFSGSLDISSLAKGQHTLSIKVVTADKKGYYQPDQRINFTIN
jgi:hypothetical protein